MSVPANNGTFKRVIVKNSETVAKLLLGRNGNRTRAVVHHVSPAGGRILINHTDGFRQDETEGDYLEFDDTFETFSKGELFALPLSTGATLVIWEETL